MQTVRDIIRQLIELPPDACVQFYHDDYERELDICIRKKENNQLCGAVEQEFYREQFDPETQYISFED